MTSQPAAQEDAVLIAGGYGIVGGQVAQLIRQRHPDLPLMIGGRNPARGQALCRQLGGAESVRLDTGLPHPLEGLHPRAVLATVNDPHDYLLADAVRRGIPLLDITRWTQRVHTAVELVAAEQPSAPVILSSGWMAGVASVVAIALVQRLVRVDRIDISVLYSLKDKAGPDSAEYMDRLATPFEVVVDGTRTSVRPFTDVRAVSFPGGQRAKVYRFDTPDQWTLPTTTGASTVAARIGFDDALSTRMLVILTRTGVWRAFSGDFFTPARRRLLYNPGAGASHEIVIEATGMDETKHKVTVRATVSDPAGQTHLTAVGALIGLDRLLGLDGQPPPREGVSFPDTSPAVESALDTLRSNGVTVTLE